MLKKFSSHAQMANTSEVAERVLVMRIGQLFEMCKHSPPPSKHASENVPGSMESKLLDWSSNRTTLNPIPGVIFTRRCSFRTTCTRRILNPASSVESHRNFQAERILVAVFLEICILVVRIKYLMGSERKGKLQKYPHNSTPCHAMCNRRSKRGSFSLVSKIDARPFIDC